MNHQILRFSFIVCLLLGLTPTGWAVIDRQEMQQRFHKLEQELVSLRSDLQGITYENRQKLISTLDKQLDEISNELEQLRLTSIGPKVDDPQTSLGAILTRSLDHLANVKKIKQKSIDVSASSWKELRLDLEKQLAEIEKDVQSIQRFFD